MKRELKTFIAGAILISSVLLVACQKGKSIESKKENPASPKQIILTEKTIFLLNGKEPITYKEYTEKKSSIVSRNFSNDENIMVDYYGNNYIFDNDSALIAWTQTLPDELQPQAITHLLDQRDSLQDYATVRGIIDDSLATVNYSDSLNGCDGHDSTEVVANAGIPLITSLYDGYSFTGTPYFLAFISIRPTLGSFNDRASSLQDWYLLPKLNFLAEHSWFRGRKFWYWSWHQFSNLNLVNFNNITSSKL